MKYFLKTTLFFLVFIFLSLYYLVVGPNKKSVYAEVSDAKDRLAEWECGHQRIRPQDYKNGRVFASAYRQALLDLFQAAPKEQSNPMYVIELRRMNRLLDPPNTSFHIIT